MAKYIKSKDWEEVSTEEVDRALAQFSSTDRLVDDEKTAIAGTDDAKTRRLLRQRMNLAFRERVLVDLDGLNKRGLLTQVQKDALRAAAASGSSSMKDFAFCARVPLVLLKKYLEKHERFAEELALLGNSVTMAAKRNIASEIQDGDIGLSQWWLERHPESDFNLNSHLKDEKQPIVIIMPNGKQPQPEAVNGEVVREEDYAGDNDQALDLAS